MVGHGHYARPVCKLFPPVVVQALVDGKGQQWENCESDESTVLA